MMRGGPSPLPPSSGLSQEEQGEEARQILSTHLNTALPPVLYANSYTHLDCIPPPAPGHRAHVAALRRVLDGAPWGGRFQIVGAGVDGVSVGDCVQSGREAGNRW